MTIIDTPDGIAHARIATLIAGLRLETATGMKVSQFSLVQVAKQYGFEGRTKKKALEFMEDYYQHRFGWRYGESRKV